MQICLLPHFHPMQTLSRHFLLIRCCQHHQCNSLCLYIICTHIQLFQTIHTASTSSAADKDFDFQAHASETPIKKRNCGKKRVEKRKKLHAFQKIKTKKKSKARYDTLFPNLYNSMSKTAWLCKISFYLWPFQRQSFY